MTTLSSKNVRLGINVSALIFYDQVLLGRNGMSMFNRDLGAPCLGL